MRRDEFDALNDLDEEYPIPEPGEAVSEAFEVLKDLASKLLSFVL